MMKSIYTLILLLIVGRAVSAQHDINTVGFSYSPDSLAVNVGDQVTFNSNFSLHPLMEVSASDWATGTATQLPGGFSHNTGNTYTITISTARTYYYLCSAHGFKGRIFAAAPNGVQSITAVAATAYPNPASGQLHIVYGKEADIHYSLINMLGQAVMTSDSHVPSSGLLTLDISSVAEGAYLLAVSAADGAVHTSRVTIAR